MREYESREDAERDPDLDLRDVYTCDKCGNVHEQPAMYDFAGRCHCGGIYQKTGESYNAAS